MDEDEEERRGMEWMKMEGRRIKMKRIEQERRMRIERRMIYKGKMRGRTRMRMERRRYLGPPVLHVLARGPDARGLAHLLCKVRGQTQFVINCHALYVLPFRA